MRKIIVSMNVTLDGFMAGPDCELDWHVESWSPDMAASLCRQLDQADTILLGRVTYTAMARYWPHRALDISFPREDVAFACMMNSYTKIVFSRSLAADPIGWNNSRWVKGNAKKEILKLKQQPGKDMIIYGSGKLVSSLMSWGLIDEYVLWVHPVVLCKGKAFFNGLHKRLALQLLETTRFSSGVVRLSYQSVR